MILRSTSTLRMCQLLTVRPYNAYPNIPPYCETRRQSAHTGRSCDCARFDDNRASSCSNARHGIHAVAAVRWRIGNSLLPLVGHRDSGQTRSIQLVLGAQRAPCRRQWKFGGHFAWFRRVTLGTHRLGSCLGPARLYGGLAGASWRQLSGPIRTWPAKLAKASARGFKSY